MICFEISAAGKPSLQSLGNGMNIPLCRLLITIVVLVTTCSRASGSGPDAQLKHGSCWTIFSFYQ